MEQEQLSQLVEKIVLATFSDNKEFITKELANNLDWADGWERTISQAVMNAVSVSTRLTVQLMLTLLTQSGAFEISEEALRPYLTVIRGGADSESPDPPPQR